MQKNSVLFLILSGLLAFSSCSSNSNSGGGTPAPAEGQKISPQDIKLNDYPNVSGKIFGSWKSAIINISSDSDQRKIQMSVKVYVSKTQTAFRVICAENNKIYADLAGITKSSVNNDQLVFAEKLTLSQDDLCGFNVPAKAVAIEFSQSMQDSVTLRDGEFPLYLTRTSESPMSQEPVTVEPSPAPGNGGTQPGLTPAPNQPGFPNQPGAPIGGQPGPQPGNPFPDQPDFPGSESSSITFYAGSNCNGVSITVKDPNQCFLVRGFMIQSIQFNGMCTPLQQATDAAQFCQ